MEADIFYSEPSVLKENEILLIILMLNNKLKIMIQVQSRHGGSSNLNVSYQI